MWRSWLIHGLFFVSGASGLIYEVVWVREFGVLFGSTVYSAALVTALYMSGLGVGGYLAGRWADRRFRTAPTAPLRSYAHFEFAIAGWALLLIPALPWVAQWSAGVASYEPDASGWYVLASSGSLARYGAAALLLAPISLLLGGTLTLLIRFLVGQDVAGVGGHVGRLYAVNTAGAALGCLSTDTWLVPVLGLSWTQGVAVGGNLFAAFGALWLARSLAGTPLPRPATSLPGDPPRLGGLAGVVALSGFLAMAMQIVWFRHLISIYGASREVFSILLTAILCGIWVGSWLGGEAARRWRRPGAIYAICVAGFVATTLVALGWASVGSGSDFSAEVAGAKPSWWTVYGVMITDVGWSVVIPAAFSGAVFPVANALAQRDAGRVGAHAGLLYLCNTLGGVAGSLLAGFVLLPSWGVQGTTTVVVVTALAALVLLGATTRRSGGLGVVGAAGVGVGIALVAWSTLPADHLLLRSLPERLRQDAQQILAAREGVNETIAVTERDGYWLELVTNGYNMSATTVAAQRYMRAFSHLPALVGDVRTAMVMCFGVGNTTHALLLHEGVERVDVVDLSRDVLEHARYFAPVNGEPLADPRVRVHVNDARHHLRMAAPDTYDLVTGEPPPLRHAGIVNLYTHEFFILARRALREGGMLSYWLPIAQLDEAVAVAIAAAFVDVFPESVLVAGHGQHLLLLGRKDQPIVLDPERVATALAEQPRVREDLRAISLATPGELFGALLADGEGLRRATDGATPLRDDHPILEYGHREFGDGVARDPLFPVPEVAAWCPGCASLPERDQQEIRGHREILRRFFLRGAFLGNPRRFGNDPLTPDALRALTQSFYLQNLLARAPAAQRRARTELRHGRADAARADLEGLLVSQPGRHLARVDLAASWLALGEPEKARRELAWVLERVPDHTAALGLWHQAGFAPISAGASSILRP
ncbi:MAG: fused MFS/spermidine synthase [Myxococcota bacterium]